MTIANLARVFYLLRRLRKGAVIGGADTRIAQVDEALELLLPIPAPSGDDERSGSACQGCVEAWPVLLPMREGVPVYHERRGGVPLACAAGSPLDRREALLAELRNTNPNGPSGERVDQIAEALASLCVLPQDSIRAEALEQFAVAVATIDELQGALLSVDDGEGWDESVDDVAPIGDGELLPQRVHDVLVCNTSYGRCGASPERLRLLSTLVEWVKPVVICETDCRSKDGVTVGLIDSLITTSRLLAERDLTGSAVLEALKDLRADRDVRHVLTPDSIRASDSAAHTLIEKPPVSNDERLHLLRALIAKLPTLDLMWPDRLKDRWFEAFERLRATAAGVEFHASDPIAVAVDAELDPLRRDLVDAGQKLARQAGVYERIETNSTTLPRLSRDAVASALGAEACAKSPTGRHRWMNALGGVSCISCGDIAPEQPGAPGPHEADQPSGEGEGTV